MERIFDPWTLLALAGATVLAVVFGLIVAAVKHDGSAAGRAVESGVLALLGGFLAHTLISVLLSAGQDRPGISLLVGWGFFLVHGLVDTILAPSGVRALTTPGALLWTATAVGALTGMLNGTYRVYAWRGLGVFQFLGDTTWGLTGSTTGGLLHLLNCIIGRRSSDERTGANRFETGFHMPGHDTFAFTQGSVMSNLRETPGQALWRHERLHVFQSRLFGPIFTLTYLGWMALLLVPALVGGLVTRQGASLVEGWCYFSNPWEAWAYVVQRHVNHQAAGSDTRVAISHGRCWSETLVAIISIPYFGAACSLLVALAVMSL